MELLSACTVGDIEEIVNELALSSAESVSLKDAVHRALERKTNGLQTMDSAECAAMASMERKIDSFRSFLDDLSSTEQRIDDERKLCEERIESTFGEMAEALHRRKQEVLHRLHRMVQIKEEMLRTQRRDVLEQLEEAERIKTQCHRLLSPPQSRDDTKQDRKRFILGKEEEVDALQLINDGIPKAAVPLVFAADSERGHLLWTISRFGKMENDRDRSSKRKRKRESAGGGGGGGGAERDEWDGAAMGDHVELSADRKRVICSERQSYCYRSCFGRLVEGKGTHHWTLRIRECEHGYCAWNMVVGVMKIEDGKQRPIYCYDRQSKLYHRNSHFTANERGYAFIGNLARLTNDHGAGRQYGCPFNKKGDVIDLYLDLKHRTLSYSINDRGYGVAFHGLERTRYCLAVTFCGNRNELEMVNYDSRKYES